MKKLLTIFTFLLISISVHAQAWAVAGGFNGWCNTCDGLYDDGTHGDAVAGDGIFTGQVTIATPGRYEWKATLWANWNTAFPVTGNSWVITTTSNQVVTFTFNSNTINDNWLPNLNIINANDMPAGPIVAAGDHQGWNNAGAQVMLDDGLDGDAVAGDGIYTWHTVVASPGNYNWKPVVSGSWDGWGADNRSVNSNNATYITTVPNQDVYLYLNKNTGRVATSAGTSLQLNFTGLIQGFFNPSISKMTPDTVTIELHNQNSPYALVDSKRVLLDSSGNGTFYFNASSVVPYWLVVKTGNTVETWSHAAKFFYNSQLAYDFTWTQGAAYGSNLVQVGSKWCIYSGDVNQDGLCDSGDILLIDNDYTNYLFGPGLVTDVNGDGVVDSGDILITDNNYTNYIFAAKPAGAPGAKHITHPDKSQTKNEK